MKDIALLVCNHKGWVRPSGRDCKSLYAGLFEARGFGYEEWLFRGFNQIIDGEKYYLGWIQAFHNNSIPNIRMKELYLSTNIHASDYCLKSTKRMIGKIEECSFFSHNDYNKINKTFFDENNNETNITCLKSELSKAGFKYDDSYIPFNVKFKKGYRYPIPNTNSRWSYLSSPPGFIGMLPSNFVLNTMNDNSINNYINLNGEIPLILP